MRPFGCPVTILNTIDHLGKFDGKADEGFFIRHSLNSKAFILFNSRTMIVEENLHIRFSKSTPNVVGSGPDWLFDIDAQTKTMNYELIITITQSNGFVGTKASDNASQARKETEHVKDYILLPLWIDDPPFSQDPNSSHDDGSKPSSDDGKKVEKRKLIIELQFDLNMPALEDVITFEFSSNDEDDGAVAHINNLDTTIQVSPIPTTRIHKDHPLDQVIGNLQSATQTRKMSKNLEEHGFLVLFNKEQTIKIFKTACLLAFYHRKNLKRNKKDERGIVIRNTTRLVVQGYTQEEEINYDEVFALVARIEAIELFLAYASFKDFVVYQMDVKVLFSMGRLKKRYKAVHKELGDRLVRAATTASSLEADDKDRMKLDELMALCTNLQNMVLDLKKTKTTQHNEIASLKRRVMKLEKRNRSRTHGLKRLYKERRTDAIDADEDITLVSVQDDADKEMFDMDTLDGEEVFVGGQNDNVVEEVVDAAKVSTAAITVTITTEEITLSQELEALKTSKPKDKGKGIMIEEHVQPKKKDQIRLDEEVDLKLQDKFDEEERLAREKSKKERNQYLFD
nr:hypothetical protein [Tanacetum cinerariifolium]